ncbi:hypothetical protein NHX12_029571 [Muraenolepis orangiensis]|uniref:Sema domain-containing protein n=1 Tax=Muraenolepis orangiensis TaxID=630683 RepID=A0A9Q0E6A6_9TELE|nr:hypothetical protein NHX12_029571 [Muraenolepis orangiensis]
MHGGRVTARRKSHCTEEGSPHGGRVTARRKGHCTEEESLHGGRVTARRKSHRTEEESLHGGRVTAQRKSHCTEEGSLHGGRVTARRKSHCTEEGSLHGGRVTARRKAHCTEEESLHGGRVTARRKGHCTESQSGGACVFKWEWGPAEDYRILRMDEDHDRMYVGSKDHILSLDLHDINKEPLIIHWPVSQQRRTECILSGKDTNGECGNFIRLVEQWNRTHLYVCGTGAYNPVCTYVNRGRKPQAADSLTAAAARNETKPAGSAMHLQMPQAGGRNSRSAEATAVHETLGLKEYIFQLEPGKVESGKGKCSYDPKLNSVSALINGELYAGVYIDFMGTDSAIFRTLGKQTAMRTDQYNSRWLNDPSFVRVQLIPDSAERNDDKLYFFFREKSTEMGQSPVTQSRIGRICLNDDGGHCCLVNKWSTFLKARLICSVPGADGMETHFDELPMPPRPGPSLVSPVCLGEERGEITGEIESVYYVGDVYIQPTQDTKNPVIYGVFSVSGSVFKGSAVCVYSMADIRMVFNGPFAHKEGPNYQWVAYSGKIPYPRPGTCPGGTFTPNMKSTKDYPDEVINFMRNHPTMYNAVYPVHKRPLVVRTNVDYEFTTITVDQVTAADGNYEFSPNGAVRVRPPVLRDVLKHVDGDLQKVTSCSSMYRSYNSSSQEEPKPSPGSTEFNPL